MQDAILAGTGNSRIIKTAPGALDRWPTHEALMRAFDEGGFLFDLLRNPSGFSQMGTDLKKETLLQDATAALAGLGAWATPNDMLAALAQNLNGKLELGSYMGTSNENKDPIITLYCSGFPKAAIISATISRELATSTDTDPLLCIAISGTAPIMFEGMSAYSGVSAYGGVRGSTVSSWSSTFAQGVVTIFSHNGSYMNRIGTTYRYLIFN